MQLRTLDNRDHVARWTAMQTWRERARLPRWVVLAEGDNKLIVDLDNVLSVDTFVREIRSRDEVTIEELFPGPDELIASGPDGHRAMELVIPFVRHTASGEAHVGAQSLKGAAEAGHGGRRQRTFPPGSDWTYLKLYCGTATADTLLRDEIGPLARDLIASGRADQWFFVRYADPRPHLRVRFHGDPGDVLASVQQLAARALACGIAHDAQFATYQREIERYGGGESVEIAERIFHADSDAVVTLLNMFEPGAKGLDERWRIGVLGAELLMRDLGLDDATRARQSQRSASAFAREFKTDTKLRSAIARRVRPEQTAIESLLFDTLDEDHALRPGMAVLAGRSDRVAPLVAELAGLRASQRLDLSLEELAAPFVHMWLDRLCRSENRFHEYLTYVLLSRALEARLARRRCDEPRSELP